MKPDDVINSHCPHPNPNRPPPNLLARVGNYQSFGAYLACYLHAVQRLFIAAQRGEDPLDMLAPPLLFMMRHSMELGYKFTLMGLHQMNEESYDTRSYANHKLSDLHVAMRKQHKKVVLKYDLPGSYVEGFEEYCEKTEAGMKQLEALDANSISFRYPADKTGKPNFLCDQTVDLLAVKQAFEDAIILLQHTAAVLGEYVDIWKHMAADFGPVQSTTRADDVVGKG